MNFWIKSAATACFIFSSLQAVDSILPQEMQSIMLEQKFAHSIWGVFLKDLQNGKVTFDVNSDKMFSPASTSKLFSVAALLHKFGDDYRFKTPVFATGNIENGELKGDLVLVAAGDLTFGGRQSNPDTVEFTKFDHILANDVPGVILTKQDPLNAINDLAKQVYQKGLRKLTGDVIIDVSLFAEDNKRDMVLSPMMINENLIDIVINPTEAGKTADLSWRPHVEGYSIVNQITTVAKDGPLKMTVTSDDEGKKIVIEGTIPLGEKDAIRTFSIKDPKAFARAAFIQALKKQGTVLELTPHSAPITSSYLNKTPLALWTSPPLTEYAKLILKVSHNLGADLIPLLLASKEGKKTFDEGMVMIGDFITKEVKISQDAFVMVDAAGGNNNRFTPQSEVQLLEYIYHRSPSQFQHFFDALPILGKDGSLEDFAVKSQGVGKVHAKTGTGVTMNAATEKLFLVTQALGGYIEGKNGHLFAYMLVVNNASMHALEEIYAIFEDVAQLSSILYEHTDSIDKN